MFSINLVGFASRYSGRSVIYFSVLGGRFPALLPAITSWATILVQVRSYLLWSFSCKMSRNTAVLKFSVPSPHLQKRGDPGDLVNRAVLHMIAAEGRKREEKSEDISAYILAITKEIVMFVITLLDRGHGCYEHLRVTLCNRELPRSPPTHKVIFIPTS